MTQFLFLSVKFQITPILHSSKFEIGYSSQCHFCHMRAVIVVENLIELGHQLLTYVETKFALSNRRWAGTNEEFFGWICLTFKFRYDNCH